MPDEKKTNFDEVGAENLEQVAGGGDYEERMRRIFSELGKDVSDNQGESLVEMSRYPDHPDSNALA